jgi:hypothetical protein
MSSPKLLQSLINETKAAFVVAKFDGKLEVSEVIQIATDCAQKVYALSNCSQEEKKALVMFALKKGLEAAGGLSGLTDLVSSNPAAIIEAERQILDGALVAVNALMVAAPQLFSVVQKASSSLKQSLSVCLPFCSQAVLENVLDPKDSALVAEALALLKPLDSAVASAPVPVQASPAPVNLQDVTPTLESETVENSSETPVHVLNVIDEVIVVSESLEEIPDENIVETAPNPVASHLESHRQIVHDVSS